MDKLAATQHPSRSFAGFFRNIARGTTDPEIDSETWTKLGNNIAPLALIANLATSPDGAT